MFGIRKAILNALIFPEIPNRYAATISRRSPRIRERPVAIAKMTPDRARLWLSPAGSFAMTAADGALIRGTCASSANSRASSSVNSPASTRGRINAVGCSAGSCEIGQLSSFASLSK